VVAVTSVDFAQFVGKAVKAFNTHRLVVAFGKDDESEAQAISHGFECSFESAAIVNCNGAAEANPKDNVSHEVQGKMGGCCVSSSECWDNCAGDVVHACHAACWFVSGRGCAGCPKVAVDEEPRFAGWE